MSAQEPDFEEDRIVVREGEEYPKKKSWFSRAKSSGHTPSTSTSRPPSASSYRTHKRGAQAAPSATTIEDEDLPPRTTTPTLQSGAQTPTSPGVDSELPAHAGFDLAAMKAVIGDKERNTLEGAVVPPTILNNAASQFSPPPPHTDVSALRSQSAPPHSSSPPGTSVGSEEEGRDVGMTPRTRAHELDGPSESVSVAAGPSRGDLSTTFSRTLSLSDSRMQGAEETLTSYANLSRLPNPNPNPTPSSSSSSASSSLPQPQSQTRTFGIGATSESESDSGMEAGSGFGASFVSSYSTSSFGGGGYGSRAQNQNRTSERYAEEEEEGGAGDEDRPGTAAGTSWANINAGSSAPPPLPEKDSVYSAWGAGAGAGSASWAYSNPFRTAGADMSGAGASTGLSFGGADGSVSVSTMGDPEFGADPWAARSSGANNAAKFASNPWS